MDEINRLNATSANTCQCTALPALLHDLNQSLLIINSYASGCMQHLKKDGLDETQLVVALSAIDRHAKIMGDKIHYAIPI